MAAHDYVAIDAAVVATRIGVMLRTYPELAEDEELLADALEGQTDLHSVMSRLVRLRQERRHAAEAVAEYMGELGERKARMLRGADGLNDLMKGLMDTAGIEKLVLPEATISITKAREQIVVTDADELPQGYFATIRQPDKTAIGKSLKSGETVPGAALAFGEASLTVRVK